MSERKFIIPEYGPFAGMRVIASGSLVAMPFAATMLADFGAEVIHIERPGVGDTLRMLAPFAEVNGKKVSTAWAQNARNKLSHDPGAEPQARRRSRSYSTASSRKPTSSWRTWSGWTSWASMTRSC